jgi:hypothetical protein
MSANNLVALYDLGLVDPFNFGSLTTVFLVEELSNFDYTEGGKFQILARGIGSESVKVLSKQVPLGVHLMVALGKASTRGEFNKQEFLVGCKRIKNLLKDEEILNLKLSQFNLKILPPIGEHFALYLSTFPELDSSNVSDYLELLCNGFDYPPKWTSSTVR